MFIIGTQSQFKDSFLIGKSIIFLIRFKPFYQLNMSKSLAKIINFVKDHDEMEILAEIKFINTKFYI